MPGALASGQLTDLVLLLAMAAVALWSGSITLLGETIRSSLMMIARLWALVVVTAEERDVRRRYEFGAGKLEQAGNLTIGLAMTVAGLWIGSLAFELAVLGKSQATPFGLALAATVNAMHLVRRGSLLWARASAKGEGAAPAAATPAMADMSTLAPLLIVQMTLSLAALARDPVIALAADCLGAVFVGLLMTAAGLKMLWEGLLDLIDHPLHQKVEGAIAQMLLEHDLDAAELRGMRSRRSGRRVFVELTLDPVEAGSFEELRERLERVRRRLEARVGGLDLAIRLSVSEDEIRTARGLDERR
jgi:divalent metal cation (Fe/Co/Zn/Cd) transporter